MKDLHALRWFYVRDSHNNPVGVVVTKRVKLIHDEVVAYNYSSLSPKDSWDVVDGEHKLRFGVQIAEARLNRMIEVNLFGHNYAFIDTGNSVKEQIMQDLANLVNYPVYDPKTDKYRIKHARLVEAATYWLSPEARAKRELKKLEEKLASTEGGTISAPETNS